jgi:hypothetical protein
MSLSKLFHVLSIARPLAELQNSKPDLTVRDRSFVRLTSHRIG